MPSQGVTNVANAIINKINNLISSHNNSSNAHQDIRESIPSATSELNNNSGFITSSSIPSASNTTPSADTTNGSVGTGTAWARSDHTHPKSSLYAEASHTHSQYLTQHQSLKTINNETLVGNGNITIDIDEEIEYIELSVDEEVSEYAYGNTIELYGTSTKDTIDNTTTNAKFLFKIPSISDDLDSSHIYIRLHYNNGNSYRTGVINKGNSVYMFDDAEKLSNAYVLVLLSEYTNSFMYFDIISKSNYAETEHIHSLDALHFGNGFNSGWESISLFTQDNDNKSVDVGGLITLDYSNNEAKATYIRNLEDYSKDYYEIATIDDVGYTIRENIGEYVGAVALSNDYDDLDNKPTIPTKTSDLTNDSSFLTSHQDITGKEDKSNKVTSLSSSSTDTQYPSAKCVYDELNGYLTSNEEVIFINGTNQSTDTTTNTFTGTTSKLDSIDSVVNGTKLIYKVSVTSTNDTNDLRLSLDTNSGVIERYIKSDNTHTTANLYPKYTLLFLVYSNSVWHIIGQSNPKLKNRIVDLIYPIGSIYMSVNNVSPQTLFGGTWEQLKDRFLLGSGDTYTNGATGGSATVTLTANQSGVPAHNHTYAHTDTTYKLNTTNRKPGTSTAVAYGTSITATANNTTKTSNNNTAQNAAEAHNNMPPYLAVYMWERVG